MRKLTTVLLGLATVLMGCSLEEAGDGSAGAPLLGEEQLEFRRVWAGSAPNFYASEPSPDGRWVSEIDWSGGDLAVRDLTTGELERVTHKESWNDSVDYAEFSVFSPDGARLAYAWFSGTARGYELKVIGVDGTGMHTLVPHDPDVYLVPEHWAPDGKHILVSAFRRDRSSSIATVSTSDGTVTVLKTSDWRHPFVAHYSPDSRWIAYDFPPEQDSRQRDVFVLAADGSRNTSIVGGPSHDILLGWLPDGGSIVFASDRDHSSGIWQQAVEEGRPVGEPVLLAGDVGPLYPLGFSRDAYYYGLETESPEVHTAIVDLANRRVVVPPKPVLPPSEGKTDYGAWSPDNRYLAYLVYRAGDRTRLAIRTAAGEETREIPLDVGQARHLQWLPDGRSVVLLGRDRKGRSGAYQVDVRTGEQTVFFLTSSNDPKRLEGRITVAADGRTFYTKRRRLETETTGLAGAMDVVAVDAPTREIRVLHEIRSPGRVSLSPDGRLYAARDFEVDPWRYAVRVGRTDGTGKLRTILESEHSIPQNEVGLPWTPDGRYVLVPQLVECEAGIATCVSEGLGRSRVLMVPVDGGEPGTLLEVDGQMHSLDLSPDGRRLSFVNGRSRGEIWRIDNLPGVGMESAAAGGSR